MLHVSSFDIARASSATSLPAPTPLTPETRFSIGPETASHVAAREALLDRSMGPGRLRKSSETIRRGRKPAYGLAFAATGPDGTLLATLRLWHVFAGKRRGTGIPALLLGPLAVDPAAQGSGLGGAMMRHAILAAQRFGHGAIVLVGDPDYYVRFGFSATPTADLTMPGPFEPHRLLARELKTGALEGTGGIICGTGIADLDQCETLHSARVVGKQAAA